jgi:hypothetical protein
MILMQIGRRGPARIRLQPRDGLAPKPEIIRRNARRHIIAIQHRPRQIVDGIHLNKERWRVRTRPTCYLLQNISRKRNPKKITNK